MSEPDRIAALEAQIEALRAELAQQTGLSERLQEQAEAHLIGAQHRLRNLLASVRSIASHTADHAQDIDDYIAHFDGRIAALARCQAMLTRSPDMRIDFEELVREEFLSHAADHTAQISLAGPSIRLGPRNGEALALAVHELAAKAVKFGALSNPSGRLDVRWREQEGELVLDWTERGAPLPVRSERDGFGRQLIEEGLPFQLGARTALEFGSEGVHSRITTAIAEPQPGFAS